MNIYEKLQQMRVELQEMKIKKSGKNKFAGYDYYELADILPPINSIMAKNKVCSIISYGAEEATLRLVNAEKPDEQIKFSSPMAEANLKGTHAIQNLGAVETYQRRYLYMTAFEIVENDFLDATQGKEDTGEQKKKPSTATQKPVQQKAARQQTQATLSKENGELVNSTIKFVAETTGSTAKEIITFIEQNIHKPIKQLKNEEVNKVMELLNNMAMMQEAN